MSRIRKAASIRARRREEVGWREAGERLLAGPAQGIGGFVLRVVTLGPGGRTPRIDLPAIRVVLVMHGEVLHMDGDGTLSTLGAGDVVIVDPGERHHFQNDSRRSAGLLLTDATS